MPLTPELSTIRKAITKCLKMGIEQLDRSLPVFSRPYSGNAEENDPKEETITGEDHDTSPIPYL
jgi:hypothetical protein